MRKINFKRIMNYKNLKMKRLKKKVEKEIKKREIK
jgi:hypothetical protein